MGDILSLSSDFRLSLTGTCPSPMVLCGSGDLALTGIAGVAGVRVKHFAIFEKLVFALTSRTVRILMEHIDSICSSEPELSFGFQCSIIILSILEVIAKTSFPKITKCSTLAGVGGHESESESGFSGN